MLRVRNTNLFLPSGHSPPRGLASRFRLTSFPPAPTCHPQKVFASLLHHSHKILLNILVCPPFFKFTGPPIQESADPWPDPGSGPVTFHQHQIRKRKVDGSFASEKRVKFDRKHTRLIRPVHQHNFLHLFDLDDSSATEIIGSVGLARHATLLKFFRLHGTFLQ